MESEKPETSSESEKPIEFKKPVLIGRIGKLPKKVIKSDAGRSEEVQDASRANTSEPNTSKNLQLSPVFLKEMSIPIPYKEPKWSGVCPDGSEYALEVVKSGLIIDKIELTTKPYITVGRLGNCDIVMAHPTVSRYHCALQYKAFADEGEPACGWYLFDLGSTHGTFLNKDRLKPHHYTRVRVGHQLRFGNSTRTYILLGPDFDCEGESELSVTEIKQRALNMKLDRAKMTLEEKDRRQKETQDEAKKREEQGIDWGMGEDAEEEPDLSENPYAVPANEELYLDDPKKTLRGYFEREGHELNYNCEERGVGQFLCRVELPMDDARGRPVVAEVIHKGKKKEAVVACALEACRVLDRAGLLRQAKHESRRKKERDWSADDFYDSDDDTFLDRTGSVEKKRKQRMIKLGAGEESKQDKALTYDDLLQEISETEKLIASEEKSLDLLRASNKPEAVPEGEDALDAYMSTLTPGKSMAQKAEISKAKMTIQKLKVDLAKTQRLAELARPAHLPPLVKKTETKMAVKMGQNSVVYGKRIRLKEEKEWKPKVNKQAKKQEEEEFVEEMDSDEETAEPTTDDKNESSKDKTDPTEASSSTGKKEKEHIDDEEMKDVVDEVEKEIDDQGKNAIENGKKKDTEVKGQKDIGNREEKAFEDKKENDIEDEKKNHIKGEEENDIEDEEVSGKKRKNKAHDSTKVKMYGPMRPPEHYVIPENYFDQESDRDLPEITDTE